MTIILTEENVGKIVVGAIKEGFYNQGNPYMAKASNDEELLNDFLYQYGKNMYSIETGKIYRVFYDKSLSFLLGKNYGISKLLKDGKLYGSIMVKPMSLYKLKN